MRILIALLLLLHGILHLPGFVKSFYSDFLPTLSRTISRSEGALWLLCSILLVLADVFFLTNSFYWPMLSITGALLSQFLVSLNWEDAKYGTIFNLLILGVSFPAFTRGVVIFDF